MELEHLIYIISKEVRAILDKRLAELDLGYGQFNVLMCIVSDFKCANVSQTEISNALNINKANTTRNIQKLESKHLVKREKQGREYIVTATEAGKKITKAFTEIFESINKDLAVNLTSKEHAQLTGLLNKVYDSVYEANISYKEGNR